MRVHTRSTLAPGLRVGFVSGRKDIIDRIVVVKQVNDVHTPVLNQMMVYEYIKNYDYDGHIAALCEKSTARSAR